MRKEADDTGPLAELEYWKHRTAKFSCLVDQIKSQPCRGVISTLNIAKAKIIKVSVVLNHNHIYYVLMFTTLAMA